MQDTVDQAHGAVPRALADIIAVLSVCRRWIPGTMSAMSTTTIRTLACSLPVILGWLAGAGG